MALTGHFQLHQEEKNTVLKRLQSANLMRVFFRKLQLIFNVFEKNLIFFIVPAHPASISIRQIMRLAYFATTLNIQDNHGREVQVGVRGLSAQESRGQAFLTFSSFSFFSLLFFSFSLYLFFPFSLFLFFSFFLFFFFFIFFMFFL